MANSDLTRDELEQLSIHALRSEGRRIGVSSPTTKPKSELVESILQKQIENATMPQKPAEAEKPRKGRPPKSKVVVLEDSVAVGKEEASPAVTVPPAHPEEVTPVVQKEVVKEVVKKDPDVKASEPAPTRPEQEEDGDKVRRDGNNGYNNQYNNGQYNNQYNKRRRPGYSDFRENGREPEEDAQEAPLELREGVLEIMADGYGFLRAHNFESGINDAYVSAQRIKKYGLRKGDKVKAEARPNSENRPAGVVNVLEVNGMPPEAALRRVNFDSLTPIYPDTRYKLEVANKYNDFAIRSIDMIAPIGKGQRAMIVSPPKAGKTTLLKQIAFSIAKNYPEAYLLVLLIDERPEEVTDMQRSIKGEVVFSTFDEMPEHHTKAAELVLERAKRMVELGKDVVILMDSLTRLARAYNLTISPTGRTLSGGIDPGALHSPKRFFGAARNIENGGSLTIIATALVDTGSRMDDVIYEEFKGTGNMEIHLDRRLSEKRIFPAIDLYRSGTRREELLLDQTELQGIWAMRKMLSTGDSADATENLISMLVKTKTNKEFIEQLNMQLLNMQKQGYII